MSDEKTFVVKADVLQAIGELEKLAGNLKAMAAASMDSSGAIDEVTKSADEAAGATDKLSESTDKAGKKAKEAESGFINLAKAIGLKNKRALAASAAVAGVALGLQKLWSEYDKTSNVIGAFSGSVDIASRRTAGLISNLDLMRNSNVAAQAGLQLTDTELANVAVAAQQFADATGEDATSAMDTLTQALATGSARGLKPLGIDIEGVTDRVTVQRIALLELQKRFGSAEKEVSNYNDVITKLGNLTKSSFAEFVRMSDQTKIWSDAARTLVGWIDQLAEKLGGVQKVSERGINRERDLPGVVDEAEIEKEIAQLKEDLEKKQREERSRSHEQRVKEADDVFAQYEREMRIAAETHAFLMEIKKEEDQKEREKEAAKKKEQEAEDERNRLLKQAHDEKIRLLDEEVAKYTQMGAMVSGPVASSYASFIDTVVSGQATAAEAAKAMVKSILSGIGQNAIAQGSFEILKGIARALTGYGMDPTAQGLIATGGAMVALGSGLTAGGAAISAPSPNVGGMGGPAQPVREGGNMGNGGGGMIVVNVNAPIPLEDVGRMNDVYDRAARRRHDRV